MNSQFKGLLIASILGMATAASSSSSTPPEAVPEMESLREGDLPSKIAVYYANLTKDLKIHPYERTDVKIVRLGGDSAFTSKKADTVEFNMRYLALTLVYNGTTYAGTSRRVADARIIKARRLGKPTKSGLAPIQPDDLESAKPLDPKLFGED